MEEEEEEEEEGFDGFSDNHSFDGLSNRLGRFFADTFRSEQK